MDALPDLERGLGQLGYDAFRPGQREAIEALFEHGRALLVAPTGGGKSLVYQLPAVLLPGTTLVISPLVSLMQDQVRALEERGVAATFLAATLDADEMRRRLARLHEGAYRLAYVAPERLAYPGFRALCEKLQPPLVAIDEAHCISEWGHDFRPDYLQIGALLEALKPARILACTATATPFVRDEILARLGLGEDTPQLVRGFARPNLGLRAQAVSGARERDDAVDAALREALDRPGAGRGAAIVYCPTRKSTEEEAARLRARGWAVDAYHAGLAGAQRTRVQQAFSDRALEVVAATNAFGMGIDRADVRAVIHLAPPGSIEAYYQEVGRAGRDGEPALGLMLHTAADLPLRRRLIEAGDGRVEPAVVEHKWGLFLELMRWAEGGSCRHDAILRYFGDEAETTGGCGRCDVCRELDEGGDAQDEEEATLVVRKALSAVARIHDRFGLSAAVKLLRGEDDPRLARSGLDRTPTFGVLKERREEWLTQLLRRCVTAGFVDFSSGERPLARLTAAGRAVMRAERAPRLKLPAEAAAPRSRSAAGSRRARPAAADEDALSPAEQQAFEALRSWRLETARAEAVPPYVVASDRTLRDLARLRPRGLGELQQAHGIGPAKVERYGARLLRVLSGIPAAE
ncbi:MAG: ATP-dependent DNA helicase [Vicinamibacteria bacterium]|nr:ATP-dependent DNA helicase [Vicinamibacteria bacterium]